MNELQPDQSYGSSYDEPLFLSYQKFQSKCLFVITQKSVISIKKNKLPIKLTLKSVLLLVRL